MKRKNEIVLEWEFTWEENIRPLMSFDGPHMVVLKNLTVVGYDREDDTIRVIITFHSDHTERFWTAFRQFMLFAGFTSPGRDGKTTVFGKSKGSGNFSKQMLDVAEKTFETLGIKLDFLILKRVITTPQSFVKVQGKWITHDDWVRNRIRTSLAQRVRDQRAKEVSATS
jgi:hypothetical protein